MSNVRQTTAARGDEEAPSYAQRMYNFLIGDIILKDDDFRTRTRKKVSSIFFFLLIFATFAFAPSELAPLTRAQAPHERLQ